MFETNEYTTDQAASIGLAIAKVLHLRKTKDGLYSTTYGKKTALGLGRVIISVTDEAAEAAIAAFANTTQPTAS